MNETELEQEKSSKEEIRKGGVFLISPEEMEIMSAEICQIDGIVELAKYDTQVKKYLLLKIIDTFNDDLELNYYDIFGSKGKLIDITDEKLDKIIQGIEETVNENIELEGVYYNDNLSAYGCVPKDEMKDTRTWIKDTLRG